MALQDILQDIQKNIQNIHTPICIYIGVGSAGHMVFREGVVDDLYYHQYPKCLEEINNYIPNITMIHILIDPTLESPPFMTIDKSKGLEFNLNLNLNPNPNQNLNLNNNNNNNLNLNSNSNANFDYFVSNDSSHIVYCVKKAIKLAPYEYDPTISYEDITNDLSRLNAMCIENNILLVYNDFTGRPIKPLADYFDQSIKYNLDHLIYGIGSRGDLGCYINLLDLSCKFAFRLERNIKRDCVKIFNINHLMLNNLNMIKEIERYPIEQIEIISASIDAVLSETYENFNTNIFSILRPIYQLMINKTKIEELNFYLKERIQSIVDIKLYFDEKNYGECFDILLQTFSSELKKVIYIKNIQSMPLDLLKYITSEPNEYKWIHRLKSLLED